MRLTWLLALVFVVACQEPVLPEIGNVAESDTVMWLPGEGLPVLEVRSSTGLGTVTLSGKIPAEFLVRLHLQGLERFRLQVATNRYDLEIAHGDMILSPEVSTPLILISLPEGNSGFEVGVKLREIKSAEQQISLSWVDFFR